MTEQDALVETVTALINRRSEGTYWDFKRCHHNNKDDLIHDVLCLANCQHNGSRFLIFGVDDADYSLHSISSDSGRRTQADIARLFGGNADKFFQSRFPDFYLAEVEIRGVLLDVLVIEDTPHKPYYLVERYEKIRAHHIYTRVCDTNTGVDETAPPHEIERMWRERFGLDRSPLDRVKLLLDDFEAWEQSSEIGENQCDYHKSFPEFTLKISNADEFIARNEEWTRGEIRTDNNHAWYYDIYFHQTRLARVRCVTFDDHKKSMVAPDWEPRGAGRFYFYEAGSIEHAVQKYHSAVVRNDHSTTLRLRRGNSEINRQAISRWESKIKIPVLSAQELNDFLGIDEDQNSVEPSCDDAEQYELFLLNLMKFEDWRNQRG